MLGISFHFKEIFGLKLFLCLVSMSHVAAQGFFPPMAEGVDPFAQQRKIGMEFIDAQMEASEALPPMQRKQYIQQLNRQKMALSQNYGYPNQQQYQRSSSNRGVYPNPPNPTNVQTPYGLPQGQNPGYQVPFYMQQYRQPYSGIQPKPQTKIFVVDPETRQLPSVPQKAVPVQIQTSQNNIMSSIPQTRMLQVMIPGPSRQMVRPMSSFAQLPVPQIIIVSRGDPELNNSPTSQLVSQPASSKPKQGIPLGQNSRVAKRDSTYDLNSETTAKSQVTIPSVVASTAPVIITTPNPSNTANKMDMIKTSNFQNVKKDVNIHEVIDDALKAHIKSKQKALEASLQAQLTAKQKALEADLKNRILNKHKTLEAALNAEIMTKHQKSETALREQIYKKQRTLESLLKAQMLAKHKALESAMETLTKQNLEKAQAIKAIGVTDANNTFQNSKNIQNSTTESISSDKTTRETKDLIDKRQQTSAGNKQTPTRISAKVLNTQQMFGQSQFRPRVVSETQGLINGRGVNILGTVPYLSRSHQIQTNSRLNSSFENKEIVNQVFEQKTTDYAVESTVSYITSTLKPKIVQLPKVPETVQESLTKQHSRTMNGDINSSRRIPKLMIKLSANESSQRNLLQNMNSSDKKRLVNYFLRRMVRQPQRETSRITRTMSS